MDLVDQFLELPRYAVVGASRDESKYGYKVFMNLLAKGYEAWPVNPKANEIEGHKCYDSLSDLPGTPDVVSIIVPPAATMKVVQECAELGLKRVWMQPGAESRESIDFCHEHDIEVIHDQCVMVLSGPRKDS